MKAILYMTFFKRLITSLIIAIEVASCNSFYYHTKLPLNAHLEFAFKDMPWSATSDSAVFKMDLLGIIEDLSPKDIVAVIIKQSSYETIATYKNNTDNPYWYEIINNDIELFWFVEDNYCGVALPDADVTIISKE